MGITGSPALPTMAISQVLRDALEQLAVQQKLIQAECHALRPVARRGTAGCPAPSQGLGRAEKNQFWL